MASSANKGKTLPKRVSAQQAMNLFSQIIEEEDVNND